MNPSNTSDKNRLRFSLDLRIISILLLVVIAAMLIIWKPWVGRAESGRTITVSGDAKISAEPDEYTFQPSYEFKDATKEVALAALTKKSDEIVKKLKELGVASSKITINSDSYDYYYFNDTTSDYTYTLRPSIKVAKGSLVQKVQDYLVSTTPTGQISPQAAFSDTYKKVLERDARDKATKEARAKADQTAGNLGFKVAKVKSVEDSGNGIGSPMHYAMTDSISTSANEKPTSLSVMPGENEITYTVKVVYYIR